METPCSLWRRFSAVRNAHFDLVSTCADATRKLAETKSGKDKDDLLRLAADRVASFSRKQIPFYNEEEARARELSLPATRALPEKTKS